MWTDGNGAQAAGTERVLGEARLAEIDPMLLMDLRGWLARPLGGATPQVFRDVTIVVGELMTNAFRHAEPPFAVRLSTPRSVGGVRVEVGDSTFSPTTGWPLGRGLLIVRDLCAGWGVEHRPDGKVVWADVTKAA
ncbi:MAG: ATP-binding protein [Actinophytocola sp.]|uniref:ATP-binding protein n=1 Tax=Actinophytocola sp. TaxID=1872138 RepID=UPI003D6BA564